MMRAGPWVLVVLAVSASCATETAAPGDQRGGPSGRAGSGGSTGSGGLPSAGGGGASSGGLPSSGGSAGQLGGGSGGTSSGAGSGTGGSAGSGNGGSSGSTGSGGAGGEPSAGGAPSGGGASGAGGAGGPPPTCGDGVAFCDDFEDGDANGWTESGGTWTVESDDSLVYEGGNGSQEAIAGSTWTDQTVQARVKIVSFGGGSDSYRAGIVARYSSASVFYVFALGADGNLTLRKSTSAPSGSSGTCGAIAAGIDETEWFTLKMVVSGGASSVNVKTYLNDALVHDCTTTSGTSASGKVGLLTYGSGTVARFDDLVVTTP